MPDESANVNGYSKACQWIYSETRLPIRNFFIKTVFIGIIRRIGKYADITVVCSLNIFQQAGRVDASIVLVMVEADRMVAVVQPYNINLDYGEQTILQQRDIPSKNRAGGDSGGQNVKNRLHAQIGSASFASTYRAVVASNR